MLDLDNTVAVLGAGFSVPAGLPPANAISRQFLELNDDDEQRVISDNLGRYWHDVFGYEKGREPPSFEDHFTLLDLAANVGHNIGHQYPPALLRAVRRISIHRVFEILDQSYRANETIRTLLARLAGGSCSSVVSLNWDIVVENTLFDIGRNFTYGIGGQFLDGRPPSGSDFSLIKLHGSANWHYCDSCHSTLFGGRGHGKTTLVHRTFLEASDFERLHGGDAVAAEMKRRPTTGVKCSICGNPKTTARVATFSYAKAFDFFPFHASWDAALHELRRARQWLFIGYSLPDADFAFKHLLKTAQLASENSGPTEIRVIVKERTTNIADRFRRFFGRRLVELDDAGLEDWVHRRLT